MRSLAARPRPAAAGRPPRPTRRRLPTPRRSLPPPAAAVPSFVDAAAAAEIQEPAARDVLEAMVRTPLHVEGVGTVQTAWVGNGVEAAGSDGEWRGKRADGGKGWQCPSFFCISAG